MKRLDLLKSLGLSAMILLSVNIASAQRRNIDKKRGDHRSEAFDHTKMAERQSERLAKELDLNDDTKEKVAAINKEYAEKMSEITMSEKANGDKEGSKIKALNEEREAKLKNVLSKDEYAKYESLKKERSEKFADRKNEARKNRGDFSRERGPRKN